MGKSSLVLRFAMDDFQENKEPTIGAAFLTQKVRLDDSVLKLDIWDTAGQERFHSLAPMYYRNAQAAIVVYDITRPSSLNKAQSWIKELQRQENTKVAIALVGNKLDLDVKKKPVESTEEGAEEVQAEEERGGEADVEEDSEGRRRQIAADTARAFAEQYGLIFMETSAKTGEGVVEMFTELTKKLDLNQIVNGSRTGRGGQLNSGNVNIGMLGDGGFGAAGQSGQANTDKCAC